MSSFLYMSKIQKISLQLISFDLLFFRGYLTVDRYGEIIDNKRTLMYLSDGKTQVEPITYHSTMYGMLENKL
jgi:hypothetical protein